MKSIFPIVLVMATILAAYVGAYLGMGEVEHMFAPVTLVGEGKVVQVRTGIVRRYHQEWLTKVFVPAAWVESKYYGRPVTLYPR
jgi:hypothetical protein